MTRDKIQDFSSAIDCSLLNHSFVKLSLGHYKGAEPDLKNIIVKKIIIKREDKLSFTYRYKTRDIVKNYPFEEGLGRIEQALDQGFHAATLFTTAFDLNYETMKKIDPTHTEAPSTNHDKAKKRLIEGAGKPWLHDLNITDESGVVYKAAQDKFRQINKYVEILDGLIRNLPAGEVKKIVDMGSGKGYLTFALYDHLHNTLKMDAQVTGVEFRPDLVNLCNKIARSSGFDALHFVEGSIAGYKADDTNILIALHACDTATDDAIAKGVRAGAELIVVAPCCHKQIRSEMEKQKARNDLDFLLKYGIFTERQAEMVTDGLRALILEYFGYTTKVFEFIGGEHTPKNVMIVGTKNPKAKMQDPAILARINAAKAYFGIERHHLEKMLEI
jgi:SAM-dependent methyltransferase